MKVRLEHANLAVRNVDAMITFLTTAFPDFRVRHDHRGRDRPRWVHLGTQDTYIALSAATSEPRARRTPYGGEPGVDHIAFEVDDVEALRARLSAAGYADSTIDNAHPHRKRVYFRDPDGNDWEFVEYSSDDPAERNDYALPDTRAEA